MAKIGLALKSTKENMISNKWLAIATIIVATVLITVNSILLSLAYISNRAVQQYEKERHLTVYFEIEAPEDEVLDYVKQIQQNPLVESVDYIDKARAVEIFTNYQKAHGGSTEGYNQDWFPASVSITADSLDDLETISAQIMEDKDNNPIIEDVVLKQDIITKLKRIRRGIYITSIVTVGSFSILTVLLIAMAINFNILTHKKEIEIMHLVGTPDKVISTPFILEGVFYTTTASLFASSFILLLLFSATHHYRNPLINDLLYRLDMPYLYGFDFGFVAVFVLLHLVIGALLGYTSSFLTVRRYLKFKQEV